MTQEKNALTTKSSLTAGSQLLAIIPSSFEEVQRFATMAAVAGLYKTDDDKKTVAIATMAILHGMEVGIPPIQALHNIAIINGRPTIWGEMVPALLFKSGFSIEESIENKDDEEKAKAICTVTRTDGAKITREFSVKDAKKAGLWDERLKVKRKKKDGAYYEIENDSPWFRFPYRMLQMRARGFATRDGAPDVLRGLYIREEIEEHRRFEEALDITPREAIPSAPIPPSEDETETHETRDSATEEFVSNIVQSENEEFLTELDFSLSTSSDYPEFHDIWIDHMESVSKLTGSDRERADAIYTKHEARIEGLKEKQGKS